MIPATASPLQARLRALVRPFFLVPPLLKDQCGSSSLEHAMMLALLLLGTTSVLGSAASFFVTAVQHLVAGMASILPA